MRHTSLFHQMASKFNHGRLLLSVLTVGMLMWSSMSNICFFRRYRTCSPKHIYFTRVLMRVDFIENKNNAVTLADDVTLYCWLLHARKCLETMWFFACSCCCLVLVVCGFHSLRCWLGVNWVFWLKTSRTRRWTGSPPTPGLGLAFSPKKPTDQTIQSNLVVSWMNHL